MTTSFLLIIITLLVLHFIGDFLFQSDWMAINKSKEIDVLFYHCLVYSILFLGFGIKFWFLTLLTHFITDFFTSKLNAYLFTRSRHWFFVAIGFDQLIHYITLLLLLKCKYGI